MPEPTRPATQPNPFQRVVRSYRHSFNGLSRDIWVLSFIMFVNRAGLMVVPFLSLYFTTELGFTKGDAGYLMTFYGLGTMAGAFTGGWLTDRYPFYYVQLFSLFGAGVGFVGMIWLHEFWSFAVYLFVVIAVSDAFRPANLVAITAYSTAETRTRSLSLVRLAINLGIAFGPALGGFLAKHVGYEWLFIVNGGMCLISAVLLKWLLRPVPVVHEVADRTAPTPARRAPSAWHDRTYLIFGLGMLCIIVSFMEFIHALGVFLKESGSFDEADVGGLYTLNGLLIFALEMPIIYYIERRFGQMTMILVGGAMIVFSYLLFPAFGATTLTALFCMLCITFGEILSFPFSNAFAADRSAPSNRGSYMQIYTLMFATGHVVAPPLALRTAEYYGWEVAWTSVMLTGVVGLLILGYVKRLVA